MARSIGIRVHKGAELVDTQVFDRDIIKIGRLASAHLRLEDPKVSRIHAVIDIAAGGNEVSIIDMGSQEGTRVNGEKVSRVRLKHGDEVGLGDSRLVVILDEAEIAAIRGGAVPASVPMGAVPADVVTENSGRNAPSSFVAEPTAVFITPMPEAPKAQPARAAAPPTAAVPRPQAAAPAPAPAARAAAPAPAVAAPIKRAPPPPRAAAPMPPLPPIPEDHITSENRFVEVTLRWGNDVAEVRRVRDVPKFTIGSGDGVDLFVPLEGVASSSTFDLLKSSAGNGWSVRYTPRMGGTVARGPNEVPLASAGGMPEGDASSIPLTDDTRVTLHFGQFSVDVRPVPKSRFVPMAPIWDMLWANTALVSVFMMATMASVMTLMPVGVGNLDDDLLTNPSKFQTLIMKPPPKDNPLLQKLKGAKGGAEKAKGKEGKAGDKKLPKEQTGKAAAKQKDKPTDEQVVANKLNTLFGGKNGGMAELFGESKGGNALQAALGGISGDRVAGAGEGSLGVRGGGPGGGGTGTNTFGSGKVGTRGKGSGEAGYGSGDGGLGTKSDREISMQPGTPIVMGSLDKEIIRRIVQEHASQIRYCYEHELTRTPGIFGKIMMKWVIDGEGKVNQASVAETQMKNSNVETCIARKIQGWVFPKPKGGGIVVVSYPFVFKQSG